MKKSIMLLFIIFLGCTTKPHTNNVTIGLINNGRDLKILGIDVAILNEIAGDTIPTGWQSLMPIYRMPADTDQRDFQKPQPGKYLVEDGAVRFTPDTPFAKQATYFLRYYQYGTGNTALDYIKQGRKLGKTPYIDLIFKR